ncbi:response regulator [Polaromonas sp. SM01]|uniref:response regulator n=1 Tax=Polaromonas sp. SM01 TaxID=3085630 RepID=UPI0029828759|nr:response regulator [Polaromonas sp. SM01]MDW5444695.1 response regulator [Polaromonas sp. SM01]
MSKRTFSLRRILVASLLVFALLPAGLVAWLMARSSAEAVENLAGSILLNVATRIEAGTQAHLGQAHNVLNGLFPERLTAAQTEQARDWLSHGSSFEPMAFALSRQSPDVPSLYFGNSQGEYFAVDHTESGTQVLLRRQRDTGLRAFMARQPGDRSRPLATAQANFEPRTRGWYQGAMVAKGRTFSPVQPVPGKPQLFVTLSQPVYDGDGGAAGVFGVDLYLQRLADLLQTQRISARGAAYIVDESGLLVAGSAGDGLFQEAQGKPVRRSPQHSANPAIRESFAALQREQSLKREDSVASNTALQRLPMTSDTLLMVQRPFGESLGLHWTLVVAAPESDFTADITRAWKLSLIAIAGLVLLGALAALYVATRIGHRLQRLSAAAQQLGRGEVPRIERNTHLREVRELSQVMHDSAEQLQSYRAEVQAKTRAIEEANELLEERVAQRTVELLASREEALQAAKAKAAFLATMSHEIRTPLNGVVGMSTLLAETSLDDEQSDYLQTIRLSSDQLLAVINDVLDFSKIESGKLDLEAEPLSPRSAVEEACDIAAPRAREKNLELIVDVPEVAGPGLLNVPAAIAGDITRIRQVLINLINNAVKFTEKGEVAVSVRQLPNPGDPGRLLIEFRVSDSGIGIPPDRIDALFQAFTQVDTSTTRKYGGTGLGLAICKRLVELMGGEIGVDSVLGKGSTFWFTIQAPPAVLPALPGTVDAAALQGKHVLVIDDHVTNVRVLTRQLQLWGMQVRSAESGAQALQGLAQVNATPPDIIITDMHMPEMDGVTLARTIKAQPTLAKVPLVLLTSGFMPPGHEAAQLFEARLLKPARQKQLFDTLARCLSAGASGNHLTGPKASAVTKNMTLLVVDDNAVNLKVACAMLVKLGYQTETALDGLEAVQAVARVQGAGRRFGAVLMDVNMPRMNGFQATQQIQTMMGERAPPIIALTAAASPEDRARCAAAGMDDYLTKPLHVAALAQALERWLPAMTLAAEGAGTLATEGDMAPLETPEPALAPEPQLMDMERLAQFKEFDDDELSMTREVIALFVADAALRVQAIEQSIRADDALALAWAAHALVGATGNVGAVAMQAVCSELEVAAKAGQVPVNAVQQLERLQVYWEKTSAILDTWV